MPRRHFREVPGAIYHLILRGNNREFVFGQDREKGYLLFQLEMEKQAAGFDLFGFVIMSNHYHLILRTGEKPLHKIMHRINLAFSRQYNNVYERTGHVFEGPYTGIPVQREGHLLSLLRYVHQNPIKAGLCSSTGEYPWSSDDVYRCQARGRHSRWERLVDTELILDRIDSHRARAFEIYEAAMADLPGRDERDRFEDTRLI